MVGEMRVVGGPQGAPGDDPKAVVVTVEPAGRWAQPVTLERIKQEPVFADWALVRMPRLSVIPVSPEQWRRLEQLRDTAPAGLPSTRRRR